MSAYHDRRRRAYERGSAARLAGITLNGNPYKARPLQTDWHNGWAAAGAALPLRVWQEAANVYVEREARDPDGVPVTETVAKLARASTRDAVALATLFAASPLLLAALRKAVRFFEENGGEAEYTWLAEMKAAIAAAGGAK